MNRGRNQVIMARVDSGWNGNEPVSNIQAEAKAETYTDPRWGELFSGWLRCMGDILWTLPGPDTSQSVSNASVDP